MPSYDGLWLEDMDLSSRTGLPAEMELFSTRKEVKNGSMITDFTMFDLSYSSGCPQLLRYLNNPLDNKPIMEFLATLEAAEGKLESKIKQVESEHIPGIKYGSIYRVLDQSLLEITGLIKTNLHVNESTTLNPSNPLYKYFDLIDKAVFYLREHPVYSKYYQLIASPGLLEVLNLMESSINKQRAKKLVVFSVSEIVISAILASFKAIDPECAYKYRTNLAALESKCPPSPDFAENIIFEFHFDQTTKKYFVKIRHNGNYISVCNDSEKCSYEEFVDLVKKVTVEDWSAKCGLNPVSKARRPEDRLVLWMTILLVAFFLLTVISIFFVLKFYMSRETDMNLQSIIKNYMSFDKVERKLDDDYNFDENNGRGNVKLT